MNAAVNCMVGSFNIIHVQSKSHTPFHLTLYLRSLETPWKECIAWNMVNQEASAVKYWYSGELANVNSENKNLITQLCQTTKGSETYKAVVIYVLTNLLYVFQVSVMYCAYVTLDN